MTVKEYGIEEHVGPKGQLPLQNWLISIKDAKVRAKITARIQRASHGNFGEWKKVKGARGLFEIQEHYGPGYRVYFAIIDGPIALLLAGSTRNA